MIFFLVLGLWPLFWVTQRRRPFAIPSRKFAPRCKEVKEAIALWVAQCDATLLPSGASYCQRDLFRCERGDDFFEARITAERVPVGMEFE
jgi:hypothetical protein